MENDAGKPTSKRPLLRRYGIEIIASLLVLVLVAQIVYIYNALAGPVSKMDRAKQTLRAIGEAELSYQSSNSAKEWGSLQGLQKTGYWPVNETLTTAIEGHTMSWTLPDYEPLRERMKRHVASLADFWDNCFTVIAYPNRPRGLNTLAITEDMVVRKYNPKHGNVLTAVKSWDPIL